MKKIARLFLSLLFIVALPIGFAFGDGEIIYNSDGVKGTRVSVEHQKGKLAGGCNGRSKNDSCQVSHAINSVCEVMGKNDELSCVARECEPNYLVHLGYGNCKTLKEAEDFCKKKKCENGKAPVPDIIANPNKDKFGKLRSGKAFRDCFCQIEKPIEYSCGTGQGTPPTNTGKFTNLDTITIAENTCSKSAAVFTGWSCSGDIKQPGDTISIEDKATCTAQWQDCAACNPGKGCGCSVSVKDNRCVYTTSIDKGYALVSGKDGANPQCVLVDEKECKDAGGEWKNGSCKCKSDVAGTHFDIKNKQCVCDDATKVLENGKCVVPTKCPDGATGTYPKCTCADGKEYIEADNMCKCPNGTTESNGKCILIDEKECTDAGGDWKDGFCKCQPDVPGTHFDIGKKQCVCDDSAKVIENGQCVVPTKCPEGGTYPNGCTCTGGKEYIPASNECKCPEGKEESGGQCLDINKCPDDASGEYPDCKCSDDKEYKKSSNKCESKCNTSVATWDGSQCVCKEEELIYKDGKCIEDPEKKLKRLKDDYEEKHDKEQSIENRTLTAVTTAATGIGGMELAMGLSQQKADKEADANMDAYIATMRCTYGDGKQVKAGPEEIELPGGNSEELMKLRNEYFALAADLKARKEALGMKPGIESEEILDKSQMGLYDDEFVGVETGAYESLYRATMLGSEADQAKIAEEREASKKRVIGGGVALGGGIVLGAVGNSLINGKLGEKIRGNKSKEETKEIAETTSKLSGSSNNLMKQQRTGTVLSTEDTNKLINDVKSKFE